MAGNGLGAGDSLKRTDSFKFFRGENDPLSPGERNVRISNLEALIGGSTPIEAGSTADASEPGTVRLFIDSDNADQLSYVDSSGVVSLAGSDPTQTEVNTDNIGLLALRMAILNGQTGVQTGIEMAYDEFGDQTGVDAVNTTANYDEAGNYYFGGLNAQLLILSDTTDGSTTFTNSGTTPATVTPNADVQHSTAQQKFGTSSIYFDGTNGAGLVVDQKADWNFGSGDFTIDFWAYPTVSGSGEDYILANSSQAAGGFSYFVSTRLEEIYFYFSTAGSAYDVSVQTTSGLFTVNTWHHVAIVRNAGRIDIYIDGVSDANDTSGTAFFDSTGPLTFGCLTGGSVDYNGYLDTIRFEKGTARWTTNFTPPTSAPSTSFDFTLRSEPIDTTTAPSKVRAVVLHEPVASTTLNTDVTLSVSRDDYSDSTNATLVLDGAYDSDIDILTTGWIDVSSLTSGTDLVWNIETSNDVDQRIHGVWTQWQS